MFQQLIKEHAEVMIIPQCVEKLLEHRSGSREHHKQCNECGQLFPYVTMKQAWIE